MAPVLAFTPTTVPPTVFVPVNPSVVTGTDYIPPHMRAAQESMKRVEQYQKESADLVDRRVPLGVQAQKTFENGREFLRQNYPKLSQQIDDRFADGRDLLSQGIQTVDRWMRLPNTLDKVAAGDQLLRDALDYLDRKSEPLKDPFGLGELLKKIAGQRRNGNLPEQTRTPNRNAGVAPTDLERAERERDAAVPGAVYDFTMVRTNQAGGTQTLYTGAYAPWTIQPFENTAGFNPTTQTGLFNSGFHITDQVAQQTFTPSFYDQYYDIPGVLTRWVRGTYTVTPRNPATGWTTDPLPSTIPAAPPLPDEWEPVVVPDFVPAPYRIPLFPTEPTPSEVPNKEETRPAPVPIGVPSVQPGKIVPADPNAAPVPKPNTTPTTPTISPTPTEKPGDTPTTTPAGVPVGFPITFPVLTIPNVVPGSVITTLPATTPSKRVTNPNDVPGLATELERELTQKTPLKTTPCVDPCQQDMANNLLDLIGLINDLMDLINALSCGDNICELDCILDIQGKVTDIQSALSIPITGGYLPRNCAEEQQLIPYVGPGLEGISSQLNAVAQMLETAWGDLCEVRTEPVPLMPGEYFEEVRARNQLILTFGEKYPTQKGSLWHMQIPNPRDPDFYTWENHFEPIQRTLGKTLCRVTWEGINRKFWSGGYFSSEDEAQQFFDNWILPLTTANPDRDSDGSYLRVFSGKRPKREPRGRLVRCVRAVVVTINAETGEPESVFCWNPTGVN